MKYKCKVEKLIRVTGEIEIDAANDDRAAEIFEHIRRGSDHRYWQWDQIIKDPSNAETIDEAYSVEHVSGRPLPPGQFEFQGAVFEPVRALAYGERMKMANDPYGSGLASEGACESCNWTDERWLNEFYDAATCESDDNFKVEVFRCLDDGFLYTPWKYGLHRFEGGSQLKPDALDAVFEMDRWLNENDRGHTLSDKAWSAKGSGRDVRVKVKFDDDSWFPTFGATFKAEELTGDGIDCVEVVGRALADHLKGFGYDLADPGCPVRPERMAVEIC